MLRNNHKSIRKLSVGHSKYFSMKHVHVPRGTIDALDVWTGRPGRGRPGSLLTSARVGRSGNYHLSPANITFLFIPAGSYWGFLSNASAICRRLGYGIAEMRGNTFCTHRNPSSLRKKRTRLPGVKLLSSRTFDATATFRVLCEAVS